MVSIRGGHACSKRSPHGTVIRYAHRGVHKLTSVFRQAIASQIGIAPVRARTPARERQAEEKPPRAAEAAASAHERCMDAPIDAFSGRPRQRLSIHWSRWQWKGSPY